MRVRIKLFNERLARKVAVTKLTKIETLRQVVGKKCFFQPELQKLSFGRIELEDGFTLGDYNITTNDVVHARVKARTPAQRLKRAQYIYQKEQECHTDYEVAQSLLYAAGDMVDVRDNDLGAWFEGKIMRVVKNPFIRIKKSVAPSINEPSTSNSKPFTYDNFEAGLLYHVKLDFEDLEEGYFALDDIRPRARNLVDHSEIKVGQIVMVNHQPGDDHEKGYWFDFKVRKIRKIQNTYALFGTLFLGLNYEHETKIIVHDDIYAIEKVVPLKHRSKLYNRLMMTPTENRTRPYTCLSCQDKGIYCEECGCAICKRKIYQYLIIQCNGCNDVYHSTCLPDGLLDDVILEEFYCPTCNNVPDNVSAPSTSGQSTSATRPSTSGQSTSATRPSTSGQSTSATRPSTSGQSMSATRPSTSGQSTSATRPTTSEVVNRRPIPEVKASTSMASVTISSDEEQEDLDRRIREFLPIKCLGCNDDALVHCRHCICLKCGGKKNKREMILCNGCNKYCHKMCVPISLETPVEGWCCDTCKRTPGNVSAPSTSGQSTSATRPSTSGQSTSATRPTTSKVDLTLAGPSGHIPEMQASTSGTYIQVPRSHFSSTSSDSDIEIPAKKIKKKTNIFPTTSPSSQESESEFKLVTKEICIPCLLDETNTSCFECGCAVCGEKNTRMLQCSTCQMFIHTYCLRIPISCFPDVWFCPGCTREPSYNSLPDIPTGGVYVPPNRIEEIPIEDTLNEEELEIINADKINKAYWEECVDIFRNKGREEFIKRIREVFLCVICHELPSLVTTTPCPHNFCLVCLRTAISVGRRICPYCRSCLEDYEYTHNTQLEDALRLFLPDYIAYVPRNGE